MTRLVFLCALVQLLVSTVTANAPYDFSNECVNPTNFRIVPPEVEDNVCVLMDSRYYTSLIGSSGVWRAIETDSNGGTWTRGRGGICTYQVRSCSNSRQFPQANYLLTQFINSGDVNEVLIDLAYRFTSGGYTRTFDVLYFETDNPDAQASADPDNYQLLSNISPESSAGSITLSFKTSNAKKGLYLSVRENGTCLSITSFRVYTYCCKSQTAGLVLYPDTYAPAQSSEATAVAVGECAVRSSAVDDTGSRAQCLRERESRASLIDVQCMPLGVWDRSRDCSCDPGFVLDTSDGSSHCVACPANTFKSSYSNVDSCLSCPLNSESGSGSSCCVCSDSFFRTGDEMDDVPCSRSPSSPLNVNVLQASSYSLTLGWDSPQSNGGRTDVSYSIEYQETSLMFEGFLPGGNVAPGSPREFTLNELNPVTEYTIRVTAENGVSDQDPDSVDGRTATITGSTTEGVPGKIELFKNSRGNTFTFQPPEMSNGVITGFVVVIFRDGEPGAEIDLGPFEFCFSPVSSNIPPGIGSVWIQVAATTAIGTGEPSDALPLEIEAERSCPGLSSPLSGEVVLMSSLVGGSARYFCDNGFSLVGDSRRVCRPDETWSGDVPTCEPITCGALSSPPNGRVSLRDGTRLNSVAEYTCSEGYFVTGDRLRFCQMDGTWTELEPECVQAPPSPLPPTCPSCPTPLPPVCPPTVTCTECPPSTECPTSTCPPPPTALPPVTCTECPMCPPTMPPTICPPTTTCPEVTCPPPTVAPSGFECDELEPLENGVVSKPSNSVGSVASYSCEPGFMISGPRERVCKLSAASWSESTPSCEGVSCEKLSVPENGAIQYMNDGSFALYMCNNGYSLSGSNFRECRPNGRWAGREPTCIKDCEPFEDGFENGKMEVTGVTLGSLAVFECNTPYELVGRTQRQCINGEWTGQQPTCIPPACDNEGEVFSTCASACPSTCKDPAPLCIALCRSGCSCPLGTVLDETQSKCINPDQCSSPLTFELNGHLFPNGSSIQLNDIGEDDNGLIFRAGLTDCCQARRIGNCNGPDQLKIFVRATGDEIYRNRGDKVIRLNRQPYSSSSTGKAALPGLYCCDVPSSETETGIVVTDKVCVNIVL